MGEHIRPSVHFLSGTLVQNIIDEALDVLSQVGAQIDNPLAMDLLGQSGARIDAERRRVFIPSSMVERAIGLAPDTITMFDSSGETFFTVGGNEVHFDPGSAALRLFDHSKQMEREAVTADVVRISQLVDRLDNFHFQSTCLVSSDVPESISDCYRLYIALQHCAKPVVTGTFIVDGFAPMAAMLTAVRGGAQELKKKPLAIFDACPSPPLRWSNLTAQSVIDAARMGIPSELVAMPLTGATAPVTLTGALVQHVAENLTGLIIAQLTSPGAPVIFGGSPAAFDMRAGTPPMGAIETMMMDAAYVQIGKALHLPTHAYMGLSDSKCVDMQAGLETGMGTLLAALSGVNVVSGGGMMNYESCQSLEKLVIDNEICGMAYRLIEGIHQREEPMLRDLLSDILDGKDFITHPHTLQWLRTEHTFPKIIDRGTSQQWVDAGRPTLADRASKEVQSLLSRDEAPILQPETRNALNEIMGSHAMRFGLERIPCEADED